MDRKQNRKPATGERVTEQTCMGNHAKDGSKSKGPKLAIVTTHPIQYYAPWFKMLAERGTIRVKVFYTWGRGGIEGKYDPDFGRKVEWDIPLLDGYEYEFVRNIAKAPGSHHFTGIINPELNRSIETYNPEVVFVIGWAFRSHLACLRYFKGRLPVFFRGDSTLLDEVPGIKTLVRRLALKWVYSHINKAFAVGTHSTTYFKKHGLQQDQVVLAPHAVDNGRFAEAAANNRAVESFRERHGIEKNAFVVLFAGKLEPKKNPAFLIELAVAMNDPNLVFLIVGNGSMEAALQEKAGADHRVKFLPFQNQGAMPLVYAASNVFILPSRGPAETWGLAVNEAMACGLPVVVSEKVGGAVDLVRNNGIIFRENERERVVTYLQTLINSPDLYSVAKKASLAHIQNFRFEHIVQAVENAVLKNTKT